MTELKITDALRLGVEAHKAGKIQEADRYYTAILKVQPNHPDANHNLGILAVSVNKIEQAIPLFKKALETNPKIPQFWFSFIDALLKGKKLNAAQNALIQAEEHGIDDHSIQKLQNQLTAFENNVPQREHEGDDKSRAEEKMNIDEAIRKASKHTKNNNIAQAKEIYREVLLKFPNNRRALKGIKKLKGIAPPNINGPNKEPNEGDVKRILKLYTDKNFPAAIGEVEGLITKFPSSATIYNLAGTCYAAAENYSAAIASYDEALKLLPENSEVLFNLGNVHKDSKDYERAISCYERVLTVDTNNAVAANNMGVCYAKLARLDEAISYYKRALTRNRNYLEAYNNLGAATRETGDLDQAIDIYNKCISIDPSYASAYSNQGLAWMLKGDLQQALQWHSKSVKLDPTNPNGYNGLGIAFKELEQRDLAVKYFKKSIDLDPRHADALNNLGVCLNSDSKFSEALEVLRSAVKNNSIFYQAYNNLSLSLFGQGDFAGAIESYKKGLEINPLYSQAWNALSFPIIADQKKTPLEDVVGSISCREEDVDEFNRLKAISNYQIHAGGTLADKYFEQATHFCNTSTSDLLINPNSKKKPSLLTEITQDHKKIIALTHFGRSGTGMFHSLIDGHSSVSTLPSIYFSEFFDPSNWKKIISGGWANAIDKFMTTYDVLFDANSLVPIQSRSGMLYQVGKKEGMANLGIDKNEVFSVDRALFKKELEKLLYQYKEVTSLDFFHLVHTAYNLSIGDTADKSVIFYHIHNPTTSALVNFSHFSSDISWVMMVREPLQCCESWLAKPFAENEFFKVANRIQLMFLEIDNIIYTKRNAVGVKLEDIKNDPRKTLSTFCKWMGVKEEASLYEMSAQGKKWWGDPSSKDFEKDGMDPFGKTSINREVGSIFSKRDQFLLQTLFYPFSLNFGYVKKDTDRFKSDLATIRPMLNEMFDFERTMAKNTKLSDSDFMSSGSFHLLRATLKDKWNILNTHGTYPNLIKPLN